MQWGKRKTLVCTDVKYVLYGNGEGLKRFEFEQGRRYCLYSCLRRYQ
jgi:hypothetical protein